MNAPSPVVYDPYCLGVVHDGVVATDPDERPCPVNCHDTRPWCECMCHGVEDEDALAQEVDHLIRRNGWTPLNDADLDTSAASQTSTGVDDLPEERATTTSAHKDSEGE